MSRVRNYTHFGEGTNQNIAIGAASVATSNAVADGTVLIRIAAAGGSCHWTLGASPTAATSDPVLPQGAVDYIAVPRGQSLKLAAIRVGTDSGTLSVTEMIVI